MSPREKRDQIPPVYLPAQHKLKKTSTGVVVSLGYVTLNQRGKILEANLAAATMLGVRSEALLRMKFSKFVSLKSRKRWHSVWRAAFESRGKQVCQLELRRADGARLTVRVEALVSRSDDDRCYITLNEITGQKALRESEQRFRQMGDQAPVMIWMSGVDKLCTWFNRPWLEFTGRRLEQELGNGWSSGVHPEDLARCLKTYVTSFDDRRPFTMEYRLRRRDGQFRWVLDNGVPLYRQNGVFEGYIGSCIDITDLKQTEQRLAQYRNDLRAMASELMLTEERERQRLAENLHDGLGQAIFRARMKLDQLQIASRDAEELGTILEEMGSMISTMTFELSPVVLRRLGLRHAVRMLAGSMRERYGLVVEINDYGHDVALDERMGLVLFRSVNELLINVVKHAKTDKAAVSLRRIKNTLRISIEDRGKGCNLADQSRDVESGHFGLFSIRERLNYFGGTFSIRSIPGKGTSVTLTAPLASEPPAAKSRKRLSR